MALKFDQEDNGFCRVYYRDGRKLFCWQDDGSHGRRDFNFYECTRDGEPSHPVTPPRTPLPPGETRIGKDLRDHLTATQAR